MIVNVRGTNGSGKTFAVQRLMGKDVEIKTVGGVKYTTNGEIVALGVYDGRKFGGCDGISKQQQLRDTIIHLACEFDRVVFEGVVTSTIFGPYLRLSQELRKDVGRGIVFAFMDTPLGGCLGRIKARNEGATFNEALVADKFITINNLKPRFEREGEKTASITTPTDLRRLFYG